MSAAPFMLFVLAFAVLVCAHFYPAYRAWRISRGELLSDIDPDYVRLEDYFARSFRLKVSEWLKLPVQAALPDGTRFINKGNERIRVSGPAEYPPSTISDDIHVVEGAFRCGAASVFHREILVHGDAAVGRASRLQAIAVDGDLSLGTGTHVTRWAESAGEMDIGSKVVVCSRATAGREIRLGNGAQVASAFAPIVRSPRLELPDRESPAEEPHHELTVPDSLSGGGTPPAAARRGVDPKKLHQLSPDTWLHRGDFKPLAPIRITTKLIVRGDCFLPSGSVLEKDLKASGRVTVGDKCLCGGNVVAGANISIGPGTRFCGVVHAAGKMRLGRGVRGGDPSTRIVAYALERLSVDSDVIIYGKLASGDRVEVTAAS